jgi:hypothetical protein
MALIRGSAAGAFHHGQELLAIIGKRIFFERPADRNRRGTEEAYFLNHEPSCDDASYGEV